jgi:hypothetical protein
MFRAPGLVYDGTEGAGSRFHVFATGPVLGGTEGVGSRFQVFRFGLDYYDTEGIGSHFQVLRSRTRFRRYGGRQLPFACFALPKSSWAVPSVSGPIFIFCSPRLVLGSTESDESRFHALHTRTRFGRYRGRPTLLESFSAITRAPGPVFMLCAFELIFGGSKGVRS